MPSARSTREASGSPTPPCTTGAGPSAARCSRCTSPHVGENRPGRAMATFAAVQTIGVVLAPLIGGIAGAVDYRLAFYVPAAAAIVFAMAPLPRHERDEAHPLPTLRAALTPQTRRLSAFAFFAY